MDLVVSIINHNSQETLFDCLEALKQNLKDFESQVYLVDNLCERKAGEAVLNRFSMTKVIDNQARRGFSANHNIVIRQTDSEYVLVLNPDVILPHDSISAMYSVMEENLDVAACGPALVDVNGIPQSTVKDLVKPIRETFLLACYISDINPNILTKFRSVLNRGSRSTNSIDALIVNKTDDSLGGIMAQQVQWISGACMFFRRSALREIGLFDERFYLYFEETDWCLRARDSGKLIYYLPLVTAIHVGGTSTRPNYLENLAIYVQSAEKFYEKHKGKLVSRLMITVVRCTAVVNLFRWSIISWIKPKSCRERGPWLSLSRKIAYGKSEPIQRIFD